MGAELRRACGMRARAPVAGARHGPRAWRWAALLLPAMLAGNAMADGARTTSITAQDVRQLDTRALAARLLPPELAGHAQWHELLEYGVPPSDPPRLRGVRFRLPVQPVDGVCGRPEYFVGLSPGEGDSLHATHPSQRTVLALGPQCDAIPPEAYAQLQMRLDPRMAADALRWLARLRGLAAGGGPLPDVSCSSEIPDMDACAPGVVAILTGLPLERIHAFQPTRPEQGVELSVMPNGPGRGREHAFWNVRLLSDPATRYRVQLKWMVPPPF